MSLIVYLDKARIQPALDDIWHWVADIDFGNGILTTLCGEEHEVVFENYVRRPPLKTCWECDLAYRRAMRISVGRTHPALAAQCGTLRGTPPSPA
ncbi:hypothetical protein [Amycolatopsis sp. NPDC049159]|uniref:hypothetical protein n=1 Tax=Amycolatopsis sp. NPDC049159 TaxID=3157210 RepID=UPI0033FBA3D3